MISGYPGSPDPDRREAVQFFVPLFRDTIPSLGHPYEYVEPQYIDISRRLGKGIFNFGIFVLTGTLKGRLVHIGLVSIGANHLILLARVHIQTTLNHFQSGYHAKIRCFYCRTYPECSCFEVSFVAGRFMIVV